MFVISSKFLRTLIFAEINYDSVAQLVEQLTLNQWVESSSLSGVTKGDTK